MKVNGIAKSLFVPEPSGSRLHRLDSTVDAFRMTVVRFQLHGVDNAGLVIALWNLTKLKRYGTNLPPM